MYFLLEVDPLSLMDSATKADFDLLSLKQIPTQLRYWFKYLKTWLETAEHASVGASEPQEDDANLRRSMEELCVQEQVSVVYFLQLLYLYLYVGTG